MAKRKPAYRGVAIDGPRKGKTIEATMPRIKFRGKPQFGGFAEPPSFAAVIYLWLPTSDGGVWSCGAWADDTPRHNKPHA